MLQLHTRILLCLFAQVSAGSLAAQGLKLTADQESLPAGGSLVLNALAPSHTVGGRVTFFDGPRILGTAAVDTRGEASFSTARLPAGRHSLYAVITGGPRGKSNAIEVEIRPKQAAGFGVSRSFPAGLAANFILAADFNGDGHLDLALIETGKQSLTVLLGNGDGTFRAPLPTATSVTLSAIAAGDFNHDGVADLAAANAVDGSIQILLGRGDGTFFESGGVFAAANAAALTVADFDGDGVADLVSADQTGLALKVFPGKGDGSFGAPLIVAPSTAPPSLPVDDFNPDGIAGLAARGIAAADFNGDGLLDLAVADGSGTVSLTLQLPALGPATHFAVAAPASSIAGFAVPFTVTALDSSNLPVPLYSGTVHFLSSDGQAVLPADSTLTGGAGTFSATLKTAGTQTLTARDTSNASITGADSVAVSPAPATVKFVLTVPGSGTAGVAFNFTVTAQDQFGNTATGYSGTVHFTSADPAAVLPANATLVNGVRTFSATIKTAGSQRITATDTVTSSITGSDSFFAFPAATTHFLLTAPELATAGTAFNFTVRAQDAFGNSPPGYSGTVHFTCSDPAAVLPANATLVNGAGTFSATLKTASAPTLTATDTVTASITGSDIVGVVAADVTKFSVSAPASVGSGSAFTVTVTAQDQFGNTSIAGYSGTVHFTSTDGQAILPADSGFIMGSGSLSATLKTPGNQRITATDTATLSITGTTGNILVGNAPATHLVFQITNSATAGSTLTVEIDAKDQSNATATSYSGTAHLSTTDGAATLPANAVFTAGIAFVQFTVRTAGAQTVTAVDALNSSITGSAPFVVTPARATHFTVSAPLATAGTPFSFSVTAKDQFNNIATAYSGIVHFTSSDPAATLPSNSTLVNGAGAFAATLKTAGGQTLTATDTATASITGSGPVSVVAAAASHFAVSAPASVTSAASFIVSITALDPFNNTTTTYSGTVHFTSTDAQAILPANSVLSLGVGTFPAILKSAGNQKITATDTITSSITGTSNNILVPDASATRLDFFPLSPAIAGATASTEVVARNQAGDVAVSYSGTARLTITDAAATLPANLAFTAGVAILQMTVRTAGTQTITAVDTVNSSITGTTTIVVTAGPTARFAVSAPATAAPGAGFTFTVTAQDQFNNTSKDYAGGVHFTSSDGQATLPSNSGLLNGTGSFPAALRTTGTHKITATDTVNSSITGASNPILVTTTTPIISISALVNGASFGVGPVAPNTLMTLFGTNPCGSTVQVLVDSRPTDVFFANATQINFLIPARIAGQSSALLQIVCGANASASFPLQIAAVAPAVFTALSSGAGQAANVNQDGSVETASPAGTIVALFTTGFGTLGTPDPDGLSRLILPVTAFLGETPATVVYAGEAPGYTSGLHQIDVLIPQNAPRGPAIPLRLVIGGVSTQSGVTLAIQ